MEPATPRGIVLLGRGHLKALFDMTGQATDSEEIVRYLRTVLSIDEHGNSQPWA
jgi:hypothetical protein